MLVPLLLLLAVTPTQAQAAPARVTLLSFSNSTSHRAMPTGYSLTSLVLCDSQSTSSPPATTWGTPCAPVDQSLSTLAFLAVVIGSLMLWGLFFYLGWSLWK